MPDTKELRHRKKIMVPALVCNILLVILAVPGAILSMESNGIPGAFIYYTQDSNLFLGITSVIYSAALIHSFRKGTYQVPGWVQQIKYVSICCITVTFTVVVFVLAPMAREIGGLRWLLFTGSMLFQHLLSPVIAILEFILLEHVPVLPFRSTWIALIPTLIYAAFLYPMNITGVADGPYPFLQVRNMSVPMAVMWFFIIFLLSYFFAWLIWIINRKTGQVFQKKYSGQEG